ncbi:Ribokinase-like protein [Apodospora peruviana]|uniref:Ribokinase-like protein n=1 Tax=Apodospora peruviana TaxID=516989 RepID=A0AAE0M479_9PEZI|nr:Ribokinase-like protein [Apodospora peruviana]
MDPEVSETTRTRALSRTDGTHPDPSPDDAAAGAEPEAAAGDCQDMIDFVTLGMFIIDEIEYLPPRPPVRDVLGGAGSYSALGARLFSPPPLSKSVGWIVDQGTDFPASITSLISSWDTSAILRPNPDHLTTRGWNGYSGGSSDHRAFRYTTPKRRLTAEDLSGTPLLHARAIHIICSPTRCRDLVTEILARRKKEAPESYTRPIIVWEPVPDLCTPEELLNCTNALPLVDICSPNHAELAGFMGSDGLDPITGNISRQQVEQSCEQLLASMPLQSYTLVVRAGEKGCYIAKNGGRKRGATTKKKSSSTAKRKKEYVRGGLQHDTDMEALFAGLLQDEEGFVAREEIEVDPGIEKWMPAYYSPTTTMDADNTAGSEKKKVVDPTGGGNTFLGGLAVALARGKTIEEACAWGTVAASFAIEQVGVPVLSASNEGDGDGGSNGGSATERWNGVKVEDRLSEYQSRLLASSF